MILFIFHWVTDAQILMKPFYFVLHMREKMFYRLLVTVIRSLLVKWGWVDERDLGEVGRELVVGEQGRAGVDFGREQRVIKF